MDELFEFVWKIVGGFFLLVIKIVFFLIVVLVLALFPRPKPNETHWDAFKRRIHDFIMWSI